MDGGRKMLMWRDCRSDEMKEMDADGLGEAVKW